jgi:60 kDa SS-A/Ro ribonucleoprotein
MANKEFSNGSSTTAAFNSGPTPTTTNNAGGKAFQLSDNAALAKMAMTGTLGSTFYSSADKQLDQILALADKANPEFVAKTAIYARQRGFMKDIPALLLAKLAAIDSTLLKAVFSDVCSDGKMVRNFVQIIRSGKAGRKSLGTAPKKLVQDFLNGLSDRALLNASVGASPSIADVIKLAHPKPKDESRKAFYGYLIDKEYSFDSLPEIVKQYENWKKSGDGEIPSIDFRLLTSSELSADNWEKIALASSWQQARQSLNTFLRHGVFKKQTNIDAIAEKLASKEAIAKAKVFPYQLLAAFLNVSDEMPQAIKNALQDALEISTENIPAYKGKVRICLDTSGSMGSPVTGYRPGATSKIRCVDVASLVGASILRKNPNAEVLAFDTRLHKTALNPKDSVMTNAQKLAGYGGGGTDCSIPLGYLNQKQDVGDLVIYVSDNESWADSHRYRSTGMMGEWETYRKRNPNAKLVCIDITANDTTQTVDRSDILNVAGFSDNVFNVIEMFLDNGLDKSHLVGEINKIAIKHS